MKTRTQFDRVFQTGRKYRLGGIMLVAAANGLETNRYGLMVTTRAGKAVARNRARRWIKEFLGANAQRIRNGWDVVLRLSRPEALESFEKTCGRVESLLVEARLMEARGVC